MAVDLDFPPTLNPDFNPSEGVSLESIMDNLPDPGARINKVVDE